MGLVWTMNCQISKTVFVLVNMSAFIFVAADRMLEELIYYEKGSVNMTLFFSIAKLRRTYCQTGGNPQTILRRKRLETNENWDDFI